MQKPLILGGAGFIGSNLATALVKRGLRPRIFTRPSFALSNIEALLPHVDLVYGDFMDDVAVRNAVQDVDVVFHLISTTFPGMTLESSIYDVLSNLIPTIRLLEICTASRVRKIVYASSGGTIYGEPRSLPITEDHPLVPKSAYGQSKCAIESYLSFYARTAAIEIDILRISNPYGPRQNPFGIQGLVAVAMGCARSGRPLKIYGRGEAVRDYVFISDVVDGMLKAAEATGSFVLNLSSGQGRSVMEVVALIEKVTGRTISKQFIPERKGDVSVNILSNRKAAELLRWQPAVGLEEGFSETWQWLERH
jgi:UDP-glucose 4-epimerase